MKIRVYNISNLHLATIHVDTLAIAETWLRNHGLVPSTRERDMYDYALEDLETVYNTNGNPYNVPAFANICVTC